nr:11778_t:CDS:2 [Entrophospora candida]
MSLQSLKCILMSDNDMFQGGGALRRGNNWSLNTRKNLPKSNLVVTC